MYCSTKNWRKKEFNDVLFGKPPHRSRSTSYLGTDPVLTYGCIIDERDYKEERYCEEYYDKISQMVRSRTIAQHNKNKLLSSHFKG